MRERYTHRKALERLIEPDLGIEALLDQLRVLRLDAQEHGEDAGDWLEDPIEVFCQQVEELREYPEDIFAWFIGEDFRQHVAANLYQNWDTAIEQRLISTLPHILSQFESAEYNYQQTLQALFTIFTSDFLFKTIARLLLKEGDAALRDIESVSVTEEVACSFSAQDKQRMQSIVAQNYERLPGLIADFAAQLAADAQDPNEAAVYHVLRRTVSNAEAVHMGDGSHDVVQEIFGFLRVQPEIDREGYYVGSFHLHPDIQSSGIGKLFVESVIAKYHQQSDIYARVEAENPVLQFYTGVLKAQELRREQNPDPTRSAGQKVMLFLPKRQSE